MSMNKIFGFLYFTAARCHVLEITENVGEDKQQLISSE